MSLTVTACWATGTVAKQSMTYATSTPGGRTRLICLGLERGSGPHTRDSEQNEAAHFRRLRYDTPLFAVCGEDRDVGNPLDTVTSLVDKSRPYRRVTGGCVFGLLRCDFGTQGRRRTEYSRRSAPSCDSRHERL